MIKKYKFIDLFAGIGGFHHAFHELGAECVFASEIDPYARKTYECNLKSISPELFASSKFNNDILKIAYEDINKEISLHFVTKTYKDRKNEKSKIKNPIS